MRCSRGPKKRRPPRHNDGVAILIAVFAFLGAVMCISVFSLKVMLFILALLLIGIGIFLLKL